MSNRFIFWKGFSIGLLVGVTILLFLFINFPFQFINLVGHLVDAM